jgi:hypothetical protein
MNFNPESANTLANLLELQEDIIAMLEQDIKESGENPHSLLFNADKYDRLVEKYYQIINLKRQ